MRRRVQRFFPHYAPSQLFSLASDVEAYPHFAPGCESARILEREGQTCLVENVFHFGPLRRRFLSRATMEPPKRLSIVAADGPLRDLRLVWLFEASAGGCLLTVDLDLAFESALFAAAARLAAPGVEARIMSAFEHRARILFAKEEKRP